MIAHCRIPVEISEHLLGVPHHRLDALGDREHAHVVGSGREPPRDVLDHAVARVADGIHRVPEADDDLLVRDTFADVAFCLIRGHVALLHLERELVRAAVLRPAQRADRAGNRRIDVRAGAGDHAGGEGRRVEFVLGVEVERGMHRPRPEGRGRLAVQQVQKMAADRVVLGFDVDPHTALCPVVPVEKHRAERRHEPVGYIPGSGWIVRLALRQHGAQRRDRRAHDVHRMRSRGDALQRLAHRRRDAAQRPEPGLVLAELGQSRQLAMHQEMGDLLELATVRDVEDVVAAVVQIVAGAAHGAQGGVAGHDPGQGDGLFGLGPGGGGGFGRHDMDLSWCRAVDWRSVTSSSRTARRASLRTRGSREIRRALPASAWYRGLPSGYRRGAASDRR